MAAFLNNYQTVNFCEKTTTNKESTKFKPLTNNAQLCNDKIFTHTQSQYTNSDWHRGQ